MHVFTVTKPGGTTDYEFEAYIRLLEEIGIDVSRAPRTPEPETGGRWLHVWHRRPEAERFARELRIRTRDQSWFVQALEMEEESEGAIAPLEILAIRTREGTVFQLHPNTLERVSRGFPNARLAPEVF